ncbi:AAA-type ATPase lid domain-containing protein [Asaia astilbis]
MLPPLRARQEDILILAEHFATRMTAGLGRKLFAGFSDQARERLMRHDWPGNVRELRNVVERSVYRMDRPEKTLDDIVFDPFRNGPDWLRPLAVAESQDLTSPTRETPMDHTAPASLPEGTTFTEATRAYEHALLESALRDARFNQKQAASALGLTYYQLRHLLRQHGLADRNTRKVTGAME